MDEPVQPIIPVNPAAEPVTPATNPILEDRRPEQYEASAPKVTPLATDPAQNTNPAQSYSAPNAQYTIPKAQQTSSDARPKEAVEVIPDEIKLQRRYMQALIKVNPGLGPKSQGFAEDIVRTGIEPKDALMFIRAVYAPRDVEGKGQATRLKYFSAALIGRYGEYQLANAGQDKRAFKSLLSEVAAAIDMRDDVNEALREDAASISFVNTLLLQEVGLNAESFLDHVANLAKSSRNGTVGAVSRVLEAAEDVRDGQAGNLESILFQNQAGEETYPEEEED